MLRMHKSTRIRAGYGDFNFEFRRHEPDCKAIMAEAFATVAIAGSAVAIEYGAPHVKDWLRRRRSDHGASDQPFTEETVFNEDVPINGKSESVPVS